MKKYYFLIIIIILSFFNCTVNNSTGLIVLTNLTESDIINVKIGGTTITSYISRGGKVDYWYSTTLSGKLTASGVVNNRYLYNLNDNQGTLSSDEENLEFKLNTEYKIDIIMKDKKNFFYILGGIQPGDDYDDNERDNPLD